MQFLTVIIDTPPQDQKARWLEIENEAKSRCQRGCQKGTIGYAMAMPLVYAKVYPEPRG